MLDICSGAESDCQPRTAGPLETSQKNRVHRAVATDGVMLEKGCNKDRYLVTPSIIVQDVADVEVAGKGNVKADQGEQGCH